MTLTSGTALTDQSIATGAVDAVVDDIYDLTRAVLTLQETGGEVTTDGTEQNLYVVDGPLGVFNPVCVYVDLDLMVGGDTTVFRVYYRITPGGGQELHDSMTYSGVDGGLLDNRKIIAINLLPTRFGVLVSIQRTAGGDRAYAWEILEEA